jgi:hypothetical protein
VPELWLGVPARLCGVPRLRCAAHDSETPGRPPRSAEDDHDELVYDLTGWGDDRRGALALMLTGAAIPHGWQGDVLVVPHLREAEVDELIDSIEEGEPVELPADSTVRPRRPTAVRTSQQTTLRTSPAQGGVSWASCSTPPCSRPYRSSCIGCSIQVHADRCWSP